MLRILVLGRVSLAVLCVLALRCISQVALSLLVLGCVLLVSEDCGFVCMSCQ